jgi:rRNA biogenesis protein RRP5
MGTKKNTAAKPKTKTPKVASKDEKLEQKRSLIQKAKIKNHVEPIKLADEEKPFSHSNTLINDNFMSEPFAFQWDSMVFDTTKQSTVNDRDYDDNDDENDEEQEEETKKQKQNAKKKAKKLSEQAIAEREKEISSSNVLPQNYQDYERLLAASPNSSYLWIQYMAHKLALTEIDGARQIGERALKKISYREEQEKFNIFAAMMNLESKYGTAESQDAIFKRALQYCDPKQVYIQQGKVYEQHGDLERADEIYNKMCKKFHKSHKVYEVYERFLVETKQDHKRANAILARSIKNLDEKKHLKAITKFALIHYKYGSVTDGHKIFEEVLANNPKRTDIWGMYIDAEMNARRHEQVGHIYDRVVNLNLSTKKMKSFLQRYLKFEKEHGTPEGVERVKQIARDYIAMKTNA